jgi:hypothetical protein
MGHGVSATVVVTDDRDVNGTSNRNDEMVKLLLLHPPVPPERPLAAVLDLMRFRLPEWFRGVTPIGFLAAPGFRMRPCPGGVDTDDPAVPADVREVVELRHALPVFVHERRSIEDDLPAADLTYVMTVSRRSSFLVQRAEVTCPGDPLMRRTIAAETLRRTLTQYLTTTFGLTEPGVRQGLEGFLSHPEQGIFRGPYLRIRTPFRTAEGDWRAALD